ncbi:MAG: hypothetical protein LBR37_01230 [Erysipelotrichaceae bacterium]|jgi:NAD kinase|nr:hypothetical protein [Erysipelotrichaceae bacterium]
MNHFKEIILVSKQVTAKPTLELIDKLQDTLKTNILIFDPNSIKVSSTATLIITLGGDGTFLMSVRHVFLAGKLSQTTFLGLKESRQNFGYFCKYQKDDLAAIIKELEAPQIMKVRLPEVEIDGNQEIFLNDLRIISHNKIVIDCLLNHRLIQTTAGSGVLLATGFGATGLNKSAGGPIVFPCFTKGEFSFPFIINHLQPILNHRHHQITNSLVFPPQSTITFKIVTAVDYDLLLDSKLMKPSQKDFTISFGSNILNIILYNNEDEYLNKLHDFL